MSDKEINDLIKPVLDICNTLDYGEAVVIGSTLATLIREINRLRKDSE